jgi:hypothetical protein
MNMDDLSGWYPDPTGRHQERYFNAAGIPTNLIRNDGHESTDEDRVASAASRPEEPRVVPRRTPDLSGTQAAPGYVLRSSGSEGDRRVPVARYTAPEPDPSPPPRSDDPTGQVAAVSLQPPAPVFERRRSIPWLIAAVCVLVVLVVGTGLFAFQQRGQANKWRNDYQTEVTQYRSATHKSARLFVSLLSAQHNLSLVTFQKDAICQRLDTLLLHPDPTLVAACTG